MKEAVNNIPVKQADNPAAQRAAKRIDKLLLYILKNCPDDETWKEIPWADTEYWVSDKGRVLSLCNREPRILKPYLCDGYLYVDLCGYGRRVNRLVATAFCDNPEAKPIAHHDNDNKLDNSADNLFWATHSENTQLYYDHKRKREAETAAAE